ncbi:hypothetical protein OK016_11595 [Vibrio chagasii]|nr:hypothetical protein [Vibrio chagasii]
MIGGYLYIRRNSLTAKDHGFAGVEGIFSVLMVITACYGIRTRFKRRCKHVGPLSAVVSTVEHGRNHR